MHAYRRRFLRSGLAAGTLAFAAPPKMPIEFIQVCVPDGKLQQARQWLEDYNNGELLDDNPDGMNPQDTEPRS